jgi:hypothetical protein
MILGVCYSTFLITCAFKRHWVFLKMMLGVVVFNNPSFYHLCLKVCAFNDIGRLNGELQGNDPRFYFMVLGMLITTVIWTNCSVAGRVNGHVFWVICTRMGVLLILV